MAEKVIAVISPYGPMYFSLLLKIHLKNWIQVAQCTTCSIPYMYLWRSVRQVVFHCIAGAVAQNTKIEPVNYIAPLRLLYNEILHV